MSVFTKRVDADIRDINHVYDGTWSVWENSAYNIGNPGAVIRNTSLRFIGVNIPKDSIINSAKISFTYGSTESITGMKILIKGVAEDNTGEFVSSPEDTARTRTKTTASVVWEGTISYSGGVAYDTPDIKTIIQEIVNRSGWVSGNALAIYLYDNGSSYGKYISMDEYSDGLGDSALLTVDYTPAGSPSSSVSPSVSPSSSASPSSSLSPSSSVSASSTPSASPSPSSSMSPSASVSPSSSNSPSISASVSPSSSSSPSLSPSASASPSPVYYGIMVKKQSVNKNVEDITDPKELVFTSSLGVLGLRLLDTIEGTTDANGEINTTKNHSIGYPPITIVKATAYDGNIVLAPITWRSYYTDVVHGDLEVVETFNFKVDGTKIRMLVTAYESDNIQDGYFAYLVGRTYTFNIYYYFNEIVETQF